MLTNQDVVCFSSIDWDFIWQGHQEVMAALAAQGNRVLFVENTGVRSPRLRDLPRLTHRLRNWWRSTNGFRQERDNLFVYSPLILPFPHSGWARWINRTLLLRALRRWIRAVGFRRPVVWTFLPTRLIVDLIDGLNPELVIYYCIADFEQLSNRSRKIAKSERMLLARTDIVFAQGEELQQRCLPHPNIHIFPFGVSMQTFGRTTDLAPVLRTAATPIIGYVGGVHRHLDFDLLERIAHEVRLGNIKPVLGPDRLGDSTRGHATGDQGYPRVFLGEVPKDLSSIIRARIVHVNDLIVRCEITKSLRAAFV